MVLNSDQCFSAKRNFRSHARLCKRGAPVLQRRFFFEGIQRLEQLAADPSTSKACLDEIARELTFRSTFRARNLAKTLKRHNGSPVNSTPDKMEEADEAPNATAALGVKLSTFPLSVRAQHALATLKVSVVGDLCVLTESKLLRTKNVGRKTVSELRALVRSLGLRFGMSVTADQIRRVAPVQIALPIELRIEEPSDLAGALRAHVDAATASDRNADWVIQHLGWDGQPHRTLETIGEGFNVTRERVRQVVAKCSRYLEAREIAPVALKRAVEIISNNVPLTQATLDQLLKSNGLAADGFCVDGIKRAARVFGADFPFEIRDGADSLIIPKRYAELPEGLLRSAKGEVAAHGAIVDDQLVEICREISGRSVDPSFAHAVLLSEGSFQRLPNCEDWWWRPSVAARGRNRLVNTITKVMAASSIIRIAELREACRRHVRSNHIAPPTRVLRAICSSLPFLRLQGEFVERVPHELNWDNILNPSERLLLQIFEHRGPVLDSYTVSEHGMALGINENSLTIYKTYSPILWRPIAGYYSVVGSDIPIGLIDELERKKEHPTKPTLEFGWTADHRIMVGRRLTDGVWLSGIATIPAAVQKFVKDDFSLFAFGKQALGTITIREASVFGLKPFLRMFGGDPGDVLVLLFDPQRRRCDTWLGGNELANVIQAGPDTVVTYLLGSAQPEVLH